MPNLWAAEWHSVNCLDGERRHIMNENCLPVLFRTRKQCREWIEKRYSYIKERTDLRDEPHGWRYPQPIKVKLVGELDEQ